MFYILINGNIANFKMPLKIHSEAELFLTDPNSIQSYSQARDINIDTELPLTVNSMSINMYQQKCNTCE